jgi:tetratricopeptide (TPR) repeat protein
MVKFLVFHQNSIVNNPLLAISLERKLGQAYYNLGNLEKAAIHFRAALEICGLVIPDDGKVKGK